MKNLSNKVSFQSIIRSCLFLMTVGLFPAGVFGQNAPRQVEQANKLYDEEKYDEANNKYNDALVSNPESPIINFNIGDVEYKKRNYEKALEAYQKALSSDDLKVQAKGYYNMGNTLYRLGKLPESIMHYKKALELDPEDQDAKYNLEYVRAQLKDKSEKQNQNQQQNQEQQQQQQQDQNNRDQQQNEQQQQNQQSQNRQDQQEQKDEQQEQNQDEQQNGKQQEQEEQQNQDSAEQQARQQPAEAQEISKEDAERILNALQNEEEDLLKQNRAKKAKGSFRGKDW